MRLHRFYVNKPLGEEIVVENVDGANGLIHQWTHVFRYTSGDEVFLFSPFNLGSDFLYRISSVTKQAISLVPVSSSPNIIPARELTLVMALVKKDTFETVVRQATELGVTRIIPLMAGRSEKKNLNFERLFAISIEAAEQSGRGTVPTIATLATFDEALALTEGSARCMGSLHGNSLETMKKTLSAHNLPTSLWVGPEGGWTEEEENLAEDRSFTLLKLVDTTLKADTAAVALLASLASLSSRD
jgi:16S rRNA (uracil1498-N3)-methyltransferase